MRGEKCNKEERRKSAAASSRRRIKDSPKRPINWSQSIFRMISQFSLFAVQKTSLNPKSWGIPATTYTEHHYLVYRGGLFSSLPPSIFQTARVQKQRAERKEEETDEEEGASTTSGMGRMTFRGWTNGGSSSSSSSSFFFLLGWARRRRKSKKPPIFLFTAAQLNCPTKKGEMLPSTVYRAFSSETATSQQPSTKD